jgi:23S rRNA (uridine2552-2'-O)-methyltransferase
MRPHTILRKARGSSARWLDRQTRDPYVKQRSEGGESFRSRSAFKLVSLAQKYPDLLAPGKAVVDLGAAPGGWTQVAAARVKGAPVIAVDLLRMALVPGATAVQADFLDLDTQRYIADQVGGEQRVDTVLSDMMAPMSGVRTRDVQASLDLVGAATDFARATLKVGKGMGEAVAGKKRYSGGSLV